MQINQPNGEQNSSQLNAEELLNSTSSTKILNKTKIDNTPFWLITQKDKVHITLKNAIVFTVENEEEAMERLERMTWQDMCTVMMILAEAVVEYELAQRK